MRGNFFEDFALGQTFTHATPRTIIQGDAALYSALYGTRFAPQSSRPFAEALGYRDMPLDDWLVFNLVFGKSVPDISLNAVANLGYAEGVFGAPVYAGDTLRATSAVIGLKQNSDGARGTVYVQTRGVNQNNECVLDYKRWVMVQKRDPDTPAPDPHIPDLAQAVAVEDLSPPNRKGWAGFDAQLAGSAARLADYAVGQRIDHADGMMVGDSEHMLATRLYQNTARVHFDAHRQATSRFGQRLVYGGHVIGVVRALSFNGLETAFAVAAINGGAHTAPVFGGDTLYAWSEVLACVALETVGAIRVKHRAFKNLPTAAYPMREDAPENMVLELDVWLYVPL